MQYVMTPYARTFEPFVWWQGAFEDQELDWLQSRAFSADQKAAVGGDPSEEQLSRVRRSRVSWLDCNTDSRWVFERIADIAARLNVKHYGFDLTGFGEPMQLTHYDGSEQGMYGWHQDYNSTISRKLSVVVQLSDPKDYEGGNLQVMTHDQVQTVRKQRGLITVFPSYNLHQVTPVTQGTRQSLVAWISGPDFR